ncbi:FAD-dependent oxidoreductase [Bifidobacterium actinocoloniiforme]|uniref:FAD-dependent oxidoreductase n=1 Tax=Bifidobacterium actinocoloniiforme TaxID=638619 RepID=UPI00068DAAC1|nr:FAD-dependent oxidoreductase [Bifidobacterium actinocoloniiforme]AKV55409.1 dihydrolipoamide dehydrogenase [Bifidobacterium actinocoloniiforme DSM 22766]
MDAQAEHKQSATGDQDGEDAFDLVILGSGPGGYATALRSAQLGASVALVERDPVVGGTCLNRGCIPTKALVTATDAIAEAAHARQIGVHVEYRGIDYPQLNAFKQGSVDAMTGGLSQLLNQRGVSVIHGSGALIAPDAVEVSCQDGPKRRLSARNVVIATGSRPTPLAGIPFSGDVLDSDRALALERFPERPVIIGAGAVAVEFASIWQAAGAQTTLIIRRDRVLSGWERRIGSTLTRELKRQGIRVVTGSQCASINPDPQGGLAISSKPSDAAAGQGESEIIKADKALLAIGRSPNTDAPWFAEQGIELTERGLVATDPWGRTTVPGVWALGDITPGLHFAHRAFEQGIVIAEAIAGLDPEPVDEATIPQVVFSHPQAACVGYTRQQAKDSGRFTDVRETPYPMLANARMHMSGQAGALSLITARPMDAADQGIQAEPVVVGVHMVSPIATELIAEAEQLVGARTPVSQAARLVHPHPTFSETLGEAMLKADGRPLHMR